MFILLADTMKMTVIPKARREHWISVFIITEDHY